VSSKLRTWRCHLKAKLHIQLGETLEAVHARVGEQALMGYDPADVRELLDRWCNEGFQVGHELYYYFVYVP